MYVQGIPEIHIDSKLVVASFSISGKLSKFAS